MLFSAYATYQSGQNDPVDIKLVSKGSAITCAGAVVTELATVTNGRKSGLPPSVEMIFLGVKVIPVNEEGAPWEVSGL